MRRTRYGPALSLPTTDGHELEPPNNRNVSWSANEPYPLGFLRPWNEVPALMGSAPPAHAPATATGVVTFLMA